MNKKLLDQANEMYIEMIRGFREITYNDLVHIVIEQNKNIENRQEADKYIREKIPLEAYFQTRIINWIRDNVPNAFVWKAAAGAYARKGIPDVCVIIKGKYFGFEIKRPFIGTLSLIQQSTIREIRKAGGIAEVVSFEWEVEDVLRRAGCYDE